MSTPRWAALIVTLTLVLSACADSREPASQAPVADAAAGALLAAPTELPLLPTLQQLSQRAVKVRYRSTSGVDGTPTTVSGIVLTPNGSPPEGGWRIASLGHSTSGLDSTCAPSSYAGLLGNAGVIATFVTYGYVVAMTDYQGLGTPEPHPYLEPKTAAYNVIDAVRAARQVVGDASSAWLGYGVSQGGQAVWAANELAADYGGGLELAGTISVAPPTDLRPLVDAMEQGTLTGEQRVLLPMILRGLQVSHPELRLDDYLHGVMLDRVEVFLGCLHENSELRTKIAMEAPAEDFRPSSAQAAARLRDALGAIALPHTPASAPLLVAYGDADQVVLPAWTAAAVERACALGDVVDTVVAPGQGHGQVNLGALPADWTRARFAGEPAPTTCPPPA